MRFLFLLGLVITDMISIDYGVYGDWEFNCFACFWIC